MKTDSTINNTPMVIHINLTANGALTVADQPCPADQLAERLRKLAGRESVSIMLHADEKVPFQQLKATLETCKAAGINAVSVATP